MICVRADIWAEQIVQAIIPSRLGLYRQLSQLTISFFFQFSPKNNIYPPPKRCGDRVAET